MPSTTLHNPKEHLNNTTSTMTEVKAKNFTQDNQKAPSLQLNSHRNTTVPSNTDNKHPNPSSPKSKKTIRKHPIHSSTNLTQPSTQYTHTSTVRATLNVNINMHPSSQKPKECKQSLRNAQRIMHEREAGCDLCSAYEVEIGNVACDDGDARGNSNLMI